MKMFHLGIDVSKACFCKDTTSQSNHDTTLLNSQQVF
ncbi:hypothetical protein EZS27_009886 [termite gut metagenome]|uniref:Uncharacterized protein n=1 Tax=termite gut metagenome TaxID=433724 RepID=A0A5J4S896_9ZZZZ